MAAVLRMIGTKEIGPDGKVHYTGTMSQILALTGFVVKAYIRSGETDPELLAKEHKVLGHRWLPDIDKLQFTLEMNITTKSGAHRAGPNLGLDDLERMTKFTFTRRICLQITAGFYDPMGLISVFLIRFKLALKDLTTYQLEWDAPIPDKMQQNWRKLVTTAITSDPVQINRGVRPANATNQCEIVAYFDGSDLAYSGLVYIRWLLDDHTWHTALLGSKTRVTPSGGTTTPRSELSGLVICVRLLSTIVRALPVRPRRVTIIGDSTCTISSCEVNCASLGPFFSNRVAEVDDKLKNLGEPCPVPANKELEFGMALETQVDKIWHTPGPKNPADLPTRGTVNWSDLTPDSLWFVGPDYLKEDRSTWPINRDFIVEVPETEKRSKFFQMLNSIEVRTRTVSKLESCRETMNKFNNLQTVRGSIARIARATVTKCSRTIFDHLTAEDYELADKWIKLIVISETSQTFKDKEFLSLAPFSWDGGLYTTGRFGPKGMMKLYGHDKLLILSDKSRYAKLITIAAHWEDHKQDHGETSARTKKYGVWIVNGRNLAKTVTKECAYCRATTARLSTQQMADRPLHTLETGQSPWVHIALDFMGPYLVKDEVKGRTTKKVWVILIVCLVTKALHVQVSTGYDTQSFLTQFHDYMAVRGQPRTCYTDAGTQLVAAGKVTNELNMSDNVSWAQVIQETARLGIHFRHAPTAAQWRNGSCEALVRQLKKTIQHLHKGGITTYPEFVTLMRRATSIINDRPLGLRHHSGAEEMFPVTPNNLLMSSRTVSPLEDPDRYEDTPEKLTGRLKYMEQCLADWWKAWYSQVLDSLAPLRAWKKKERNVVPGDIVLVAVKNQFKPGDFRRGLVSRTEQDDKGLVRTVWVYLYPRDSRDDPRRYVPKVMKEVRLAVQNVAVLLPAEEKQSVSGTPPGVREVTAVSAPKVQETDSVEPREELGLTGGESQQTVTPGDIVTAIGAYYNFMAASDNPS